MIVPSQLALKTHTNLGCAASFATLDKLVDKFTLPPAALPIGDASLTHVIKLAVHSSTSSTPTAMRQSFIMTPGRLRVGSGSTLDRLRVTPIQLRFDSGSAPGRP
jgi:hypothetical protein